jgi:hypothetical protein
MSVHCHLEFNESGTIQTPWNSRGQYNRCRVRNPAGLAEPEEVRMRLRVLILGLLLATVPVMGCGWRSRNAYRPPPPCCPQPAALLPATAVPCCPSPCN